MVVTSDARANKRNFPSSHFAKIPASKTNFNTWSVLLFLIIQIGFNSGTHCSQLDCMMRTMPTTLDATSLSTRIFATVIVEEIDITERHSSSHKDRDASDNLPQTLLSSNNLLVSAAVQRSTSLLRHCADGATQFLFKKAENSEEFNETRF